MTELEQLYAVAAPPSPEIVERYKALLAQRREIDAELDRLQAESGPYYKRLWSPCS